MATQCESKTKKALESWIKKNGLALLDPNAPEDYGMNYESDKDLRRSYKTDDGLEVRLDLSGFTQGFKILLKWEIIDRKEHRSLKGVVSINDNASQTSMNRHLNSIAELARKYDGNIRALTDEDKEEARRNAIIPDDDPARLKDEAAITDLIGKLDGSLQLFREMLECRANGEGCIGYYEISVGYHQEIDADQTIDQLG